MNKTVLFVRTMLSVKVAELRTEKKERIDKNLPLGLTIGGMLEVDTVFRILMEEEFPFLQLDIPHEPLVVVAYGKMSDLGCTIYRFYLAKSESADPLWYLQVTVKRDNVIDLNFWNVVDKVYPEDEDEWTVWDDVPKTPGIMNAVTFVDNVHDSLVYLRHPAWGGGDYVRPRRIVETLYLDEYGTEVATLTHNCMMFGRNSAKYEIEETPVPQGAPVEWCLITSITEGNGKFVEIRKGLDIDADSLTII